MPLFGSRKTTPPPAPAPVAEPKRTSGLFSRNKATAHPPPPPEPEKKGLFGTKRTHSPTSTTHTTTTSTTTSPTRSSGTFGSNLLHRNHEDASITAARQRVVDAENAEREADRALIAARASVKRAREECLRLEREAEEEARRARIKQQQAANISNRAKPLGRHGV